LIAVAGYAWLPDFALLWSVIGGLGLAAIFALVMTLPLDTARLPNQVGGYTALMLAAGYLIGALSPALLGAARDATGNFNVTMMILVATAAIMLALSLLLSPARLRS
jgi:CP family cyanate transporter-like MFS transporter